MKNLNFLPLLLSFFFSIPLLAEDITELEAECTKGNMTSCFDLGYLYDTGEGEIEADATKAIKYYQIACDGGDKVACYNIGIIYNEGNGVEEDTEEAAKFFIKACKLNEWDGCYNLAVAYADGDGIPQDYIKAAAYYDKACQNEHFDACYNLGLMYEDGNGINQDYKKALSYYQKACKADQAVYIYACNNIGVLYSNGTGVPKDTKEAFRIFEANCKKDLAISCANTADHYMEGIDVSKDSEKAEGLYAKAVRLWKSACEQKEESEYCLELSEFYAEDQLSANYKKDPIQEKKYLTLACEFGDVTACELND